MPKSRNKLLSSKEKEHMLKKKKLTQPLLFLKIWILTRKITMEMILMVITKQSQKMLFKIQSKQSRQKNRWLKDWKMLRMMRKQLPERSICKMLNCLKKMPRKLLKKLNKLKKKLDNSKRRRLFQRRFQKEKWRKQLRQLKMSKNKRKHHLKLEPRLEK